MELVICAAGSGILLERILRGQSGAPRRQPMGNLGHYFADADLLRGIDGCQFLGFDGGLFAVLVGSQFDSDCAGLVLASPLDRSAAMIRIGLTGSIGMGKSAVAAMFAEAGVPVFDADAEVHRLQGPGGALVSAIEQRFPGTTSPSGVDRKALGAAVMGQPAELRALEQIVHPAVYIARQRFLKAHRSRPMIILDIPLLFEKASRKTGRKPVDLIVVVSAPAWLQAKRVLARPGMTAQRLRQIRALQIPDRVKRRRADIVIETGCLRHETRRAVYRLIACLRAHKGRYSNFNA
jgi:dephospho-CoA kinase